MAQPPAAATEVARGFWARNDLVVSAPEDVTAEAARICAQLQAGLARWVGSAAYRILADRALELARAEHPALRKISCNGNHLEEITAAVQTHGGHEVRAAIITLVATLTVLLGRVVGEEIAVELVKQIAAGQRRPSNLQAGEGRDA